MRTARASRWLGAASVLVLVASACTLGEQGGGRPDATPSRSATTTEDQGPSIVSTSIAEPGSLLTLESSDPDGWAVLSALYTGLVTYDPETAEPDGGVAESLESPDGGQTWQVVLEDGWTFHDGSPVTSQAFVDAWNHGAYQPNGLATRSLFEDIQGYRDLQCGSRGATAEDVEAGAADEAGDDVPDCEGQPPDAQRLSGLEVLSDTEFTVTLEQPVSSWSQKLGYPAFAPLPRAFFEDSEAFDEEPIGNGPFRMDGAWEHDVGIDTTAYEDYAGEDQPGVDGIEFRIHEDRDAALADLYDGSLDVVTRVPPERWPETQSQVANTATSPASSVDFLAFPTYEDTYADADLRAALSMAIDRELIVETLFDGLRFPANNLLAPVVPGHEDEVCPEWSFRPEEARERFDDAGGIDSTLVVWLNEGAGHHAWLEAITNMWGEHLGIEASQVEFAERHFNEYTRLADAEELTGPFRLGWDMSHPHPQQYLQPLLDSRFGPPRGANNTGWESPEFDERLDDALLATDVGEAVPLYQAAVEVACEQVPLAPVFYGAHTVAWNDSVSEVGVDAFGTLDYTAVTKP